MKISKTRLQQIIKEEVESYMRESENVLEFDENILKETSKLTPADLSPSDKKIYDTNPNDYELYKSGEKTKIMKKYYCYFLQYLQKKIIF